MSRISHNHGPANGRGLDCTEHPVGECLVTIDPNDSAPFERVRTFLRDKCDWFGMDEDNTIEALQEAFRSLLEPEPQKVYEHYPQRHSGDITTALCGKVWRPTAAVTVVGKCPECAEMIDCGWLA